MSDGISYILRDGVSSSVCHRTPQKVKNNGSVLTVHMIRQVKPCFYCGETPVRRVNLLFVGCVKGALRNLLRMIFQ